MLAYTPLSYSGTRDLFLDLTNALETTEVITLADVVSSSADLVVSDVKVNTDVQENGADIGKGIHFSVESVGTTRETALLTIDYTGDSGSKDTYMVDMPIKPALVK